MTAGPDSADQVPAPVHASEARAAAASTKRPVLLLAVALLAASAVGLAVWAFRSIFQTNSAQVTFQSAAPLETGPQPGKIASPFEVP